MKCIHKWSIWETVLIMVGDAPVVSHYERHCNKCGKVEKRGA